MITTMSKTIPPGIARLAPSISPPSSQYCQQIMRWVSRNGDRRPSSRSPLLQCVRDVPPLLLYRLIVGAPAPCP
jgi:hypothetical protein